MLFTWVGESLILRQLTGNPLHVFSTCSRCFDAVDTSTVGVHLCAHAAINTSIRFAFIKSVFQRQQTQLQAQRPSAALVPASRVCV